MRRLNPFRAVTFDVGGTLIEPWPSVGDIYHEVAVCHGMPSPGPERINENFRRAWRRQSLFTHSKKEWALLVGKSLETDCPPESAFFQEVYDAFADGSRWRLFHDVESTLASLHVRGIPMAAISNWDERLRPLLDRLNLSRFFQTLAVSCEIGKPKPAPEMFLAAAERLGVPPEKILHVGDGRKEDFDGARAAGLAAVLIDRDAPRGSETIPCLRALLE